jgi:phosphoglycolate phosphatase
MPRPGWRCPPPPPVPPPVGTASNIGFDLDLTLVDTRRATEAAAARINEVLSASIDLQDFVSSIGLPLRQQLAKWVPEPLLDDAVSEFRATFLGPGANLICPTPGAHDALALVRSLGGRAAVITSRLPHIAERMLEACDLTADILFGGLTGLEKTSAMRETRISCYVGDHPLDMVGAQAADVYGIGVLTGFHNETSLRQAGASLSDGLNDVLHESGGYIYPTRV